MVSQIDLLRKYKSTAELGTEEKLAVKKQRKQYPTKKAANDGKDTNSPAEIS